ELLRRNFEKVSPWFGVIEPEHVRDRSNHEHLEGDRLVFSKLVMKDRQKPDKFLLPHGMPSDEREFAFSSRVPPKALKIKAPYKSWHYQRAARALISCCDTTQGRASSPHESSHNLRSGSRCLSRVRMC